ncbi:MAG: hypothetical protein HYS13_21735 [Planctomycetia bacterium]|nr:hypothetical protein [Planctomycetia bacterium]
MPIRFVLAGAICTLLAALLPPAAQADDGRVGRSTHPWAQFGGGSWSMVRKTSETVNEKGQRETTVTMTKSTLVAIDDETYTLKIETTVDANGKQIVPPPQVVRHTFEDLPADTTATVHDVAADKTVEVEIEEKKFACRVYQVSFKNEIHQTTTTTFYNSAVAPHVLKRESSTIDTQSRNLERHVRQWVIALDMPCRVRDDIKSASHLRIDEKHSGGTMTTLVVQCRDVPGGVIGQSSKEMDTRGNVIRRSTLELVDFGVKQAELRTTLDSRGHRRRWLARRARRGRYADAPEIDVAAAAPAMAVEAGSAAARAESAEPADYSHCGRRAMRRYEVCSNSR